MGAPVVVPANPPPHGATFRWKDLRHTYATRLRETGSDTATISELLGHTSERMTKRYAHAAPGLHLAAVQRLTIRNGGATKGATLADTRNGVTDEAGGTWLN